VIDKFGFLKEIKNRDPHLGMLLEAIMGGIDGVANHIGIDPTGKLQPPDPIKNINVKAGTDHVHVTLDDTSQVRKGVHYLVEWTANDPTFANPHVEHLGPSRGRMLALPAKDDSNAPINYYFRAFPQYAGSDAQSKKTFFGGQISPTAVQLTGSSKMTPLASKGSGTAAPDGSQGGLGLGSDLQRLPQGPKVPAPPRPR
jgi:hypothetical protein